MRDRIRSALALGVSLGGDGGEIVDAIVIGAGPGGCAAAWHLRRLGWAVQLLERRRYPADKLCGEFLSYDGVECIDRMGLRDALLDFGGRSISGVQVSGMDGTCWRATLPARGLGISRRVMDLALAETCQKAGVEVVYGVQARGVATDGQGGYEVVGRGGERFRARLVIGACGRQGGLFKAGDKARQASELLALQVRGAWSGDEVELHGFPGGYAGLCAIEEGRGTLGLLVGAPAFNAAGGTVEGFAGSIMRQNPRLAERLDHLAPEWGAQQAVAALQFGPGQTSREGVLLLGDAAGSINPLCGDGMSMALRGGELLAPLGDRFLRGAWSREELIAAWARVWRAEFKWRLRTGRLLEWALMRPGWTRRTLKTFVAWPGLGQAALRWSRGGKGIQ